MKPTFIVNKFGAQDKMPGYNELLKPYILKDIVKRVTNNEEYEVKWIDARNKGRLIKLETDDTLYYINLSQMGEVKSRNNYFQSVATAYQIYLNEKNISKKNTDFYFYFLPFSGNNKTGYMMFFYKIMKTIDIKFLNSDYGLNGIYLEKFKCVKDIIIQRNNLRKANSSNNSTFITDEGTSYHVYGKTFGANQKETTLLCIALAAITDKKIKLYQILDNSSDSISKDDIDAIKKFEKLNEKNNFEIVDIDSDIEEEETNTSNDKLRSAKFIYNLLKKYNGEKRCALCGCKIESIVQAAHIYPIASIKKRTDLSNEEKLAIANDQDNGIWLCENHHKLFDSNLIWFEKGVVHISSDLDDGNSLFIKQITTIDKIEIKYINERMLYFFDLRSGSDNRISIK